MNEPKADPVASFREGLKDAIAVIQKLAPYTDGNMDRLVDVCSIALESDSQLLFLMRLMSAKK